jgi:hypothetical protein
MQMIPGRLLPNLPQAVQPVIQRLKKVNKFITGPLPARYSVPNAVNLITSVSFPMLQMKMFTTDAEILLLVDHKPACQKP